MRRIRVIPMLTLQKGGLVKGIKFSKHKYIGDPINTVKIFNDKEVDELAVVDIDCSRQGTPIRFELIKEIVSEAFMPVAYGGGLKSLDDIKHTFDLGIEKVIINTAAVSNPELINKASRIYGSQSIVVSIDYKRNWLGKSRVYIKGGQKSVPLSPLEFARQMVDSGAGELIVTNIDREGTFEGYDLETICKIAESVSVPVIAHGGASVNEDFLKAVTEGGASAVAAGSQFVFTGRKRGILINYPQQEKLIAELYTKL